MALRRLGRWAGSAAVASLGVWAADVTINDEWDDYQRMWRRSSLTPEELGSRPHIVVLGTGWGAASFVRKLDLDMYRVTVVSPRNYFLFTPMLAGSTVGTVEQRSIIEPIRSLLNRSGAADATYLQSACTSIDPSSNTITCRDTSNVKGDVDQFDLSYDHLVVSVGAQPATFGTPGVKENAIFMKEISDSKKIRDTIADCLETASLPGQSAETKESLLHFCVVGGGPSGIEFAAELHDFLKDDVSHLFPRIDPKQIKVSLFELMPHVLQMFDKKLVDYTESEMRREGIDLRTSTKVTAVKPHVVSVVNPDGTEEDVPFGAMVWVAGVTTHPLVRGLAQTIGSEHQSDRRGLSVDPHLRVKGADNIWAVGDCGVSGNPPTAQVASQEGRFLGRLLNSIASDALRCVSRGAPPASLHPVIERQDDFHYLHKGSFAYIGGHHAIAEFPGQDDSSHIDLSGRSVYMAWRMVYFSKLLSARNRMMVGLDWAKTKAFGRDTSRT